MDTELAYRSSQPTIFERLEEYERVHQEYNAFPTGHPDLF